ncbi:MAG: ribose-phosphate pyrophosphokinase-like domain-containing protein [Nitrospira sp.]|nr:ribose-phosphate pyrophosphokinase-like domain-containing protein [Nitrospira sp.]
MNRELKLFSGNANLALAQEIAAYLGQKLGEATVSSFSDGALGCFG